MPDIESGVQTGPNPSALATVCNSADEDTRRTPLLAVLMGRLTNTGNVANPVRSSTLRAITDTGCGTPTSWRVRNAEILSCTRRSDANGGTTVATLRACCNADRTATCSCVGKRTSMPRALAIALAASNHARGSRPKRGTGWIFRTWRVNLVRQIRVAGVTRHNGRDHPIE